MAAPQDVSQELLHQAMAQMARIEAQVQQVAAKLHERLPFQYAHLCAFVCAWKWRLQVLSRHLASEDYEAMRSSIVKKIRMEVGSFDYQTKEQGELLTRQLCELDNVLSYGHSEVKNARKALVVRIQQLLINADGLKHQGSSLKVFGDHVIASLPYTPSEIENHCEDCGDGNSRVDEKIEDELMDDDDNENESDAADTATEKAPAENESAMDIDPTEHEEEDYEREEEEEEEEEEENDGDNDEVTNEDEQSEFQDQNGEGMDVDVSSLPIWRPYYQLQKRQDGVHLIANLRGIQRDHLRVEYTPHKGTLRISGFKLPTSKDLAMTRFNGVPTFGRFEIVQQFSPRMFNMDEATQRLTHDGVLEVRLPYYLMHHPRLLRRSLTTSPFLPRNCVVW